MKSKNILVIAFVLNVFANATNAQLSSSGFVFKDCSLTNKQIKNNVKSIFDSIDSLRSNVGIDVEIKYHLCNYFIDVTESSKCWKRMKKKFQITLSRQVGKENVIVHDDLIIVRNSLISENHLSIGPVAGPLK